MNAAAPHFLLFSESDRTLDYGQWRFVLQSLDGTEQIEAADTERDVHGERLELLAVVRGLEALPQPARVTLVTPSRYVNRGLNYGLAEWRTNDWQWEHFGEMAPVKNRDLWQRIDRAMEFHTVDCRLWKFESKGDTASQGGEALTKLRKDNSQGLTGPHFLSSNVKLGSLVTTDLKDGNRTADLPPGEPSVRAIRPPQIKGVSRVKSSERVGKRRNLGCSYRRRWVKLIRQFDEFRETALLRLGQLGTRLIPPPWFQ